LVRRTLSSLRLSQFTLDLCSTSETSYRFHREISHAVLCDAKASEKVGPILHWEIPHSVPYGCDTIHQLFHQGLYVNHLECDDCPSEDESDAPSLTPHCLSKSVSSSESEYNKFGEDPWDDSEFTTYRCNSIKISHIPSEPVINPHDYEDE
jgi:hypothetical protein